MCLLCTKSSCLLIINLPTTEKEIRDKRIHCAKTPRIAILELEIAIDKSIKKQGTSRYEGDYDKPPCQCCIEVVQSQYLDQFHMIESLLKKL
ncbi:hypothetical protein ABEB36_002657 [Hypothenemus hampei]|uniref:Uncharacterized protein n=1 Tax=Hypothenemus hampei TaxID=57062 RepID=A0ABD1F6J1_HYPHA